MCFHDILRFMAQNISFEHGAKLTLFYKEIGNSSLLIHRKLLETCVI